MSMKTSKKLKKPLDLPLGKGSLQKEVDLSHVRLPIETSVFGFKQVLSLFETATNEVKHYLTFECDLMYECRLCRTIFRSLANFILHKRKYCKEKFTILQDPDEKYRETNGRIIIQKDIEIANEIIYENNESKNISGRNLNPIIEKLMKRQENEKFVEDLINENLSDKTKPNTRRSVENKNNILLEKIDTSDVAVFQTAAFASNLGDTELMKTEVMEIHSIFDKDEAVIGADGKVLYFETNKRDEKCLSKYTLTCTECKEKFSTKKTLACHVKYKHNQSRLVYPCPLCKDTLANAWSVYRHLLKVHRKTSTQIRKYRNIIHNSATCKKVEDRTTKVRKETKEVTHKNDEENEWLDNIEGDNDLQMCGGCGKRFERKAALISHSVMCTKRIALCNSIKENSARKKVTDDRENKSQDTTFFKTQAKGSAKRKPENLITYKPKTEKESADIIIEKEWKNITTKEDIFVKVQFGEEFSDETVTTITSDDNVFNGSLDLNTINHKSEKAVEQTSAEDKLHHSSQIESPSIDSEESFSSKLSDKTGSPCKGFENNQSLKFPKISKHLMNNTNSETDCISNAIDVCVNNNIPDENIEVIMTDQQYCPKVNYKSVIKNIIGNSDNKLTVNNEIDAKQIVDFRESAVNASMHSHSRGISKSNNTDISTGKNVSTSSKAIDVKQNHSADIKGTYKTKRKRDDPPRSEAEIKKVVIISNDTDPSLTEIEDEVFISRITPYTDMPNLWCSLCSSQFSSLSHLLLHMSIHFSWYRYQCSKCSFMSYNKCDCESHVHKEHQIPFSQMQSTVLPIPTWKTATISDNVIDLKHTVQNKKAVYPKEDCIKTLNVEHNKIDLKFEPVKYGKPNGKQNSTTTIVGYIDLTTEKDDKVQEFTNENESIIMEIDRDDNDSDSPTKSGGLSSSQNNYQISPDMSKQAILEVILGDEYKKNKYEHINTSAPKTEYVRAPRNRVKSIKTSQKDFIYEMNIVRNKPLK